MKNRQLQISELFVYLLIGAVLWFGLATCWRVGPRAWRMSIPFGWLLSFWLLYGVTFFVGGRGAAVASVQASWVGVCLFAIFTMGVALTYMHLY